jgi:hypothetical protein
MPQGIVHGLEAIQIQKHKGDHVAAAFGPGKRLFQAVLKQRAVGESREVVVLSQIGQFLFRLLALDGIADGTRYEVAIPLRRERPETLFHWMSEG